MFRRFVAGILFVGACATLLSAQTADSKFLGTRWNTPGPKNAAKSPTTVGGAYGPGEADWSIMPANLGYMPGSDLHPGVSYNFDDLLPPAATNEPLGTAEALFLQALQIWEVNSPTWTCAFFLRTNSWHHRVRSLPELLGITSSICMSHS